MIHCFNCGADLPDNLAFCLHCGKELEAETPTVVAEKAVPSTAPTSKGRNIGLFPKAAGLVVLLAAMAAGFYTLNQRGVFRSGAEQATNEMSEPGQGGGSGPQTPESQTAVDSDPKLSPPGNGDKYGSPSSPANTAREKPTAAEPSSTRTPKEIKAGPNMPGGIRMMTNAEFERGRNPSKTFHKSALCKDGSRDYRTDESFELCDKHGGVKRFLD